MRRVYHDNYMVRRSETRKAIKGAIMLFGFVVIIVGLFMASDTGQNQNFDFGFNCAPVNGEIQCQLE